MTRRAWISLSLLFIVFFGLLVRLALISVDDSVKAVGNGQGSKTIVVAETRGTIYDRKGIPLVNTENAYYATLLPTERLLQRIESVTDVQEYNRIKAEIAYGAPLLARLNSPAAITNGLRVFMAPQRYAAECIAPHLIGYLDGASQYGVAGIEKAYNTVLSQYSGQITATFPINGRGEYLADDVLDVKDTTNRSAGGVMLTIDSEIQQCVERVSASMIAKGAVIVMDPHSGDVLAMASFPAFHPETIMESVERDDGALVNRALALFDCGSVFKIVTTLAALESGIPVTQKYVCNGAMTVENTQFHCHYRLGHQMLDMEEAFAQSCNLYFIQLAQRIGPHTLLNMAARLGLTETLQIGDALMTEQPVLPTSYDLAAPAALANLSFGQGKLLLSPLHVARMTAVAASGGTLPAVSAVLGTVDEAGRWTESTDREGETVISAVSTLALRRMMERVVSSGTGRRAQPQIGIAAGKTGTAETGQINDEEEAVTHSWFTGYYPAEHPQYVITVLVEDMQPDAYNAAQVFCEILNNLQ